MGDVIVSVAGVGIPYATAAGGCALIVLALLMLLWMLDRRRRGRAEGSAVFGRWMNALGFGLLPALAVWKAFEQAAGAKKGAAVAEPLIQAPLLTEGGCYVPCRIELAAALVFFLAACAWLILRKADLPDRGDLLLTALCLWCSVRIITESFREAPWNTMRYLHLAVIVLCLISWTGRRTRIQPGGIRTAADMLAAAACAAAIVLFSRGWLSVDSEIGDLAVIAGCALLLTVIALAAAADCRRAMLQNESE